jgi:hypothetical protein
MFEIEKNIPIPKTICVGAVRLYPLNEMEVGDSFFVPGFSRLEVDRLQSSIMGTVRNRYGERKFTTRQIKEMGKICDVRCWRIK